MKFKFYVLNYNVNAHKVENFNIFDNCLVQEESEKAVKKYLRAPAKFKYVAHCGKELTGFPAFCEELRSIIRWQEWSRREYEISVGDAFEKDVTKLEKWDCASQAEANIEMIAREVIWQYKQQVKENK